MFARFKNTPKFKFNIWFISVFFSIFFNLSAPIVAQVAGDYNFSCSITSSNPNQPSSQTFEVPEAWKSKFPFDLIYPISSLPSTNASTCTTVTLWGVTRDLCAVSQILSIAKIAFMLKFVLSSILSL